MKRRQKIKPYTVPSWIYRAIQVLRPPERLTVSQWAEKKRTLTGGAMPGPWRNSVTPYLVEIIWSHKPQTNPPFHKLPSLWYFITAIEK